jgi:uridine phosphorylase
MGERFTPRMLVEWWTKQRGLTIHDLGVTSIVVLTWSPRTALSFAKSISAKIPEHWMYGERFPLYRGELQGKPVSVAYLPIGAPGTVMMMDEMIACGAHTFIGLGWAGSLQESAPIGTLVIPTSCISEEGTSEHYLDPMTKAAPNPHLVSAIQHACTAEAAKFEMGPVWTTDAPYRELVRKIAAYNRKGVLAVDMETSAMYALGQARKIEVCNLLVISDELVHEWKPAFRTPELDSATEKARQVILRTLVKLRESSSQGT